MYACLRSFIRCLNNVMFNLGSARGKTKSGNPYLLGISRAFETNAMLRDQLALSCAGCTGLLSGQDLSDCFDRETGEDQVARYGSTT